MASLLVESMKSSSSLKTPVINKMDRIENRTDNKRNDNKNRTRNVDQKVDDLLDSTLIGLHFEL